MKTYTIAFLIVTHIIIGALGFSAGIYVLPILTAPPAPNDEQVTLISSQAKYTAEFRRDLKDSDMLHWGEGTVSIDPKTITLKGKLAPGPDYRLYLSPEFIDTEADFKQIKNTMVHVGDVKTFDNFIVEVPPGIDPSKFTSVIVWCEAFEQFITSAKYK